MASRNVIMSGNAIMDASRKLRDRLAPLAAERGCGLVLMHRLVPPDADSYSDQYDRPPVYDDVVAEVRAYLDGRCRVAVDRGVDPSAIVIDPGLGFGKTVRQNFEPIRRTRKLTDTGYPELSAACR